MAKIPSASSLSLIVKQMEHHKFEVSDYCSDVSATAPWNVTQLPWGGGRKKRKGWDWRAREAIYFNLVGKAALPSYGEVSSASKQQHLLLLLLHTMRNLFPGRSTTFTCWKKKGCQHLTSIAKAKRVKYRPIPTPPCSVAGTHSVH